LLVDILDSYVRESIGLWGESECSIG
jgi:hypothetical protein